MPGWFFRRASKFLLLGAALLLFACSGSRFPMPYYGPGGPPFISPKGHSLWRHASALSPRVPSYRVILTFDVPTTLGPTTYAPGQLVAWDGVVFSFYQFDAAWPPTSRVRGPSSRS